MSSEDLAYPPWAVTAKVQGVAVIRATLDSDGRVVAASMISGPKGLNYLWRVPQ